MSADPPSRALLAKDPASIATMFDQIAPRYDLLNRILSAGLDRAWRNRALRALALTGDELLLDVCTGTADVAIAASSPHGRIRRAIGIDFSSAMLGLAREKVRRRHSGAPIGLLRGDACRLPLGDATVDRVTIAFGIRNVQDPHAALSEIRRVLSPGGRLAILEFGEPTLPALRQLHRWYMRVILPRVGALVSRDSQAYSYLPASVSRFPIGDAFLDLMRGAWFHNLHADKLTAGIVYLYTGTRDEGRGDQGRD